MQQFTEVHEHRREEFEVYPSAQPQLSEARRSFTLCILIFMNGNHECLDDYENVAFIKTCKYKIPGNIKYEAKV